MLPRCVRQFASLLLVVVILTAPTVCLCQEIHADDHLQVFVTAGHDSIGGCAGQCPTCPGDTNPGADHDAAACYCACHLPVINQPFNIHRAPIAGDLIAFEPFTAMPEVYLSKFIPPQNQA